METADVVVESNEKDLQDLKNNEPSEVEDTPMNGENDVLPTDETKVRFDIVVSFSSKCSEFSIIYAYFRLMEMIRMKKIQQ